MSDWPGCQCHQCDEDKTCPSPDKTTSHTRGIEGPPTPENEYSWLHQPHSAHKGTITVSPQSLNRRGLHGVQLGRTSCGQSQGWQGFGSQDLCHSSKFEGAAEHQRHTEGTEPGFSDVDTLEALRQLRCDVESGAEAILGSDVNEDAGRLQPDVKQVDGRGGTSGRDEKKLEETAQCDRHGDMQAV
jgi:hypothetical protein